MPFGYEREIMELRHLRYYIAVAEEQNISRAAVRLHLSQPPLSRQIKDLEDELGVNLLDRIGKSVRLTEAGRAFLIKARRIVCDADTAVQQLREDFGHAARTIRLGFITPFLDDLVAPTVREYRQRHPKTTVSLFDLPPQAQLDRLRSHELDAAILGNIGADERALFRVQRLWRGKFLLVLPESHALAKRKSLKIAALAGETWVSLSEAFFPGRRAFLQQICRGAGFEPSVGSEHDSLPLMLAAVASGDGVGLMPAHAGKLPHAGCVLMPINGASPTAELSFVQSADVEDAKVAALGALLKAHAGRLRAL
jgi:DNA-binding transcriptional LysR family regulator